MTGFHGAPRRLDGLGFLPFSNCVHYEPRSKRREAYHRFLREGMRAGYAAEDGAALHFTGQELSRVVASRPEARGYRLDVSGRAGGGDADRDRLPRRSRCHARGAPAGGALDRRRRLMAVRRILALGGHEFSSRPPDRAVCELLLRLAGERGAERPRICILPTASGDTSDQIGRFYAAFGERGCEPSDLSLFRLGRRPMALRDHLLSQDLIYVGGGSLLNLLAVWEAHDIAAILSLAWRQGIVLAGQSAGAMCWFEAGMTKSSGKPLAAAGLGLLSGSLCVHYNNEPERRAAYLERGRRRDARRLRPRRLRRPALGGRGDALGGDRPPRRPRLPGQRRRGGRL